MNHSNTFGHLLNVQVLSSNHPVGPPASCLLCSTLFFLTLIWTSILELLPRGAQLLVHRTPFYPGGCSSAPLHCHRIAEHSYPEAEGHDNDEIEEAQQHPSLVVPHLGGKCLPLGPGLPKGAAAGRRRTDRVFALVPSAPKCRQQR